MEIMTDRITVKTKGRTDIIDITAGVQEALSRSDLGEGSAMVFIVGSTAGITTVEYEPGLVRTDLPKLFERLAPSDAAYAHHNTWGCDNGSAHVRATLLGCSLVVPFAEGKLLLGTWQQIVCIDFDTRPRTRTIIVQMAGTRS